VFAFALALARMECGVEDESFSLYGLLLEAFWRVRAVTETECELNPKSFVPKWSTVSL